MSFRNWMTGLHYRTGQILSPCLWPLLPAEWCYRLGVSLRILAYKQGWFPRYRPDVPVISVGNLTTGGTGKTPIVIEIARGLIRSGKTVVILSRGYGAAEPVDYARALNPAHGDEAYLIQEQVPEAVVIVGPDRVKTLQRAVRDYRPDYVILDDGFQYLPLHRDINILLFDGERLHGNGHLLPAGPLREPMAQIRRADLIFITKRVSTEAMRLVEGWAKQFGPQPPHTPIQVVPVAFQPAGLQAMSKKRADTPAQFADRPVIAFSGVANPDRFESDLREQGLNVLRHWRFADHHVYTDHDIAGILAAFEQHQADNPLLVTTDKDLTKVRHMLPPAVHGSVYTLQMLPALDGQWFYHEFLTQMPGPARAGERHAQPGHPC